MMQQGQDLLSLLKEIDDGKSRGTIRMLDAIRDGKPVDKLDCKDILEVLRLSGGHIALQVANPTGRFWARVSSADYLELYIPEGNSTKIMRVAPSELCTELEQDDCSWQPVHIKSTPFKDNE